MSSRRSVGNYLFQFLLPLLDEALVKRNVCVIASPCKRAICVNEIFTHTYMSYRNWMTDRSCRTFTSLRIFKFLLTDLVVATVQHYALCSIVLRRRCSLYAQYALCCARVHARVACWIGVLKPATSLRLLPMAVAQFGSVCMWHCGHTRLNKHAQRIDKCSTMH